MTMFLLGLWPLFWKLSAAGLTVVGLSVAALYFRNLWLAAVAAAIVCTTAAYVVGAHDGESRVRAQWTAAINAEFEMGNEARDDAVRDVDAHPDGVRNDRYNRDRGQAKQ